TSGFERPSAPVLQILWGVITRAHIDYAERIWEEFTQSIHTFIKDNKNLAQRTHKKKKATLIVILSIQFTKLIIYHIQRQHKFHPRPDSSLHLPNEEPVLGYLKFSAKGTKRKVFGMPIPGSLITADIQEASYYQEYLAKVAKHQRYLAGETGNDLDYPAPKPTKIAGKPKPTGKKRKLNTEISDKPSKAIKSRHGFVSKIRKPLSSLRSVDESMAEDVPVKEPRVDDEEADVQRALEESMKSMYDVLRGPLPPVVIREPDSEKYQPLPKVPGKGKEKATEEQSTSIPTGSSGHDESSSLYAELGLTDNEEESEEVVPRADAGGQGEGQAGPDPGAQDEGQAGSNPDEQAEGHAGPDPGNAEESLPIPSHVVHARSDREHMDLDVANVSPQPPHGQMDEGFTIMAYPKVQKNLKLTVEEHVLLVEPDSSLGTLSSLQHLTKDLSIEADNDNATVETKAESMSPKMHQLLKATATETTTTTTTTTTILPPPSQQKQSTADAMMMKRLGELEHIMATLIQENKRLEQRDLPEADTKEILHQRMWETDSYKSHEDHMQLYEAIEKSMNRDHSKELAKDLAEARPSRASGSLGASGSSQVPPPPPPPPFTNQESQSKGSAAPSSSKTATSAEYQAWTTTNIRLEPSISFTPADLQMDEDMALDEQAQSSDDEDIKNAHIPKASALASNYSPPSDDSLLAQTGLAFEIIKVFHPNVIHLQYQMEECHKLLTESVDDSILRYNVSKPLPLGVLPGQVTIQSDFFFNKDLEYLRYDSKGSRPALFISKMKAAYYLDVGLEQVVPDQMWIEEECKYDIAAIAVRTHMRILSVVRIEVFSMYGYDSMKKIVLRRTDLNEHVIAKRDFKYLYPSDFEDMYLLNLKGHLNHLPPKDKKILTNAVNLWTRHLVIRQRVKDFQLGIESCQTQLNLTKPQWDATGFEYKHDYTVIDSPRAVTFRDRYGVQMIMRFNEIHKFSDGTLQQIDEALDHRVKEFKINRMNPGLNTRFWTRKDVDRSKAFMFANPKRLKTRRIFRNLESFVGGRVIDGDCRLLKLDIEKVAVCSSLRSLKPKCTIESRAKRSSRIISLGYYSIMLASSHTMKSKADIKSPTHYPCGIPTVAAAGQRDHIKDELTIADLEGTGLEQLNIQYNNDVELEYHVRQLKAAVLSEAQLNSDERDISKPRSFERYMSKSTKPHPCFYNDNYTYLVDLSAEENYADLPRLNVNDVENMYLLQVQDKLYYLPLEFIKDFNNALLMFIKRTMIKNKGVVYLNQYNMKSLMKLSEVKKLCDGTLVKIQENSIDMLSKNKLGSGNKRLKGRDWTDYYVKSSKEMLKKIDEILRHREQLRRLEEYEQPTQPTTTFESSMTLLNTLMETCATLTQKVAHLEQDKVAQALEITKLKQRVKKLERKRRSKHFGLKMLRKVDADEDVTLVDVETAVEMDANIQGRMEEDVTAVKEINAVEFEPTVFDDEELKPGKHDCIFEEYGWVQDATLQGVSGIIQAYQSFEDMLKDFDREDLDALYRLVKERFSTAVPTVDKEKALWKLHSNCRVHQVSLTTRRHDMYMLAEKDYPFSNGVMILMLSIKLQVEEDNEMARDLVMKIYMKANQPKSKSLDTSSK
nr:E-beta-farnesene synthase [Tanacetum cinerariifolium]